MNDSKIADPQSDYQTDQDEIARLSTIIHDLTNTVEGLQGALMGIQWGTDGLCPECGCTQSEDHAQNCLIRLVLT